MFYLDKGLCICSQNGSEAVGLFSSQEKVTLQVSRAKDIQDVMGLILCVLTQYLEGQNQLLNVTNDIKIHLRH